MWQAVDQDLFDRMVAGYIRSLQAMAISGHQVVAESVVMPRLLDLHLSTFSKTPVTFVGVRCPLDVLLARESARTDRRLVREGWFRAEYDKVHAHGEYDMEVDSSSQSPDEEVEAILPVVQNPPSPSAFERLRMRVTD